MKRRRRTASWTAPGLKPSGERGAVVLWSLGLLLMLFFAGALALDLWRVLGRHGTLAGIAHKAAVAGAAELDEAQLYSNRLVLDTGRAETEAERLARAQQEWGASTVWWSSADPDRITVRLTETVPLTLLRSFTPDGGITLTVTARASPARFR